ncbi:YadA-like family protein [Burkholderia sp. S171]|uniref:YadA-like family protein n=1 Tax=Burkholderia sp. S171 TaxID=1641860 RepID=UPI00131E07F9|nr:YadA-like family protein [Burkholderia sp. S171]
MLKGLTPTQSQQVLKSGVAMSMLGASAQNWTDVLATGDTDKLGQTQAVGTDAMAIGLNTHATDAQATAIGQNAYATAQGAVAIGNGAISNGINATAIGVNASVTGLRALSAGFTAVGDGQDSIAFGSNSLASGNSTIAIGSGATAVKAATGSMVIGNASLVRGTNTIVLGSNVDSAGNNSIVLGAGSDGSLDNVVSVGGTAAGTQRRIVNVAAGTTTTDAVNLGQMTTAISAAAIAGGGGDTFVTQPAGATGDLLVGTAVAGTHVNFAGTSGNRELIGVAAGTTATSAVNLSQLTPVVTALGGGAKVDPTTGAVTGPKYAVQGGNQSTVGDALTALDGGVNAINTKIANVGPSLVTQSAAGADLLVGSATDGAHVNFAGTAGARELINVANGTTPTSAVNLSQLTPVVAGLGGGAAIDSKGNVTGPTYTIQGSTVNNAGDAFKKVDTTLTDLGTTVAGITGSTGNGLVIQDPATGDIKVGALNGGTVVDMTGTAGARRITGVAAGSLDVSSVDAINGSQLNSATSQLATAIGGGMQVDSKTGAITMPSFSVGGNTVYNVGDAITNLDGRTTSNANNLIQLQDQVNTISTGGGVATPNAVAYDSSAHDKLTLSGTAADGTATTTKLSGLTNGNLAAGSTDAVTGDQLYATNAEVASLQTAVQNASTTGNTSIGINGTNGVDGAPGTPAAAASATGNDAIAMGDNASASGDHAVVIGGGASGTGDGTIAIGGNAGASGKDSIAIAIGNGATAPANNAVALGAGSVADRDNSVSMGSQGNERQITNVAAGTQGTDAVNLNQMNSAVGGIARKAYSGIAAATALTMIPDVDANKTLSIGIGGGTFQGYAATAIGGTARITQNIKVRVGAGWSAAGTTVGAGASYQW